MGTSRRTRKTTSLLVNARSGGQLGVDVDKKECFKCNRTLALDEFYRHPMMADGRLGKCKACARKDVRENRAAKAERYREYDRQRYRDNDDRRAYCLASVSRRDRAKHLAQEYWTQVNAFCRSQRCQTRKNRAPESV